MSLKQAHLERLQKSGISIGTIQRLEAAGILRSDQKGLVYQYDKDFWRMRLDEPRDNQKYTQPKGSGVRAFLLPRRGSEEKATLVVEGEAKAISAWERVGDSCRIIGVGGVWNWAGKGAAAKKAVLQEMEDAIIGTVYICFDSDITDNSQAMRGEMVLVAALRAKHKVLVLELPPEAKGLDDWFVKWGDNWKDPLRALMLKAVPERAAYRLQGIYDQVYTYDEMLQTRFPTPKFFWGKAETMGLAGEGLVTFIHGRTNIGKTYFLLQLCCAVSAGRPFLDVSCSQGRVLLLQGELAAGLYAGGRLKPVAEKLGYIPDNLLFYNWAFPLAEADRFGKAFEGNSWGGFTKLERMIDEHQPNMVCVDPLQVYNNLAESSVDQNRELMKRFKQIAASRNVGIIITDHIRKPSGGDSDSIFMLRGAGSKADIADTVVSLQWEPERRHYSMSFDKIRYTNSARPDPIPLKRDGPFFEVDNQRLLADND